MSITGKGALSLRKKDVEQQKSIAVGFKKTQFADKPGVGATGIDLTAITLPSEMGSLGFTNPNTSDLVAANIFFYKKNFTLISSLRGELIQDLSYTINSSSRINFQGFTAEDNEIFVGIIDLNPKTTLNVVDAQPVITTGTLAANTTDINVGKLFEANKFPNEQTGAVQLYIDGVLQARNSGNQASPTDGNYYEVATGNTSSLLRMNVSDTSDRAFMVISPFLVEKPTAAQIQEIEKVQGQVDAMIPTLAQVAGVPETDFQAAPNNQDLKQFGDRQIALEQNLLEDPTDVSQGPKLATPTDAGAVVKNRTQLKILTASIATTTDIADLQFNNLIIGKRYRITGQVCFNRTAAGVDNVDVAFFTGAGGTGTLLGRCTVALGGTGEVFRQSPHIEFVAPSTTLYCRSNSIGASSFVLGDGTPDFTSIQLTEVNDIEVTTAFS